MKKVLVDEVASGPDAAELPERVQEALGELAGAAREGLLALSVGVGLGVMAELMQEEVDEVVGPKGKHDPQRAAVRHGREAGEVTLGGRRVAVERPRARTADGETEVALVTYQHFADRDPLTRLVCEQMLAGVSTRRFERTREPVGSEVEQQARSTSKSAVSREFVQRTRENLEALMSRRLDDARLAVLMIDGIDLKGCTNVVCLGITTDGVKVPLGLWEGSTENAEVATALLADLVDRGLDVEQGVLCVLDGAKALRKAVRDVLGVHTPVQRCVRHKERNVLAHLPERDRQAVKRRLRKAWREVDHDRALTELRALAGELDRSHPGAAASLREGLEETLSVTRVGIRGKLKQTLESTNPCESMIECVRRSARNVKHWQSGEMCLRWTAAGMLEAEQQFRRVIGYRDLAKLATAVEREAAQAATPTPTKEGALTPA
ncbi:MAG: IS256 family transposase [Thermoleophilaceae bacterium]|nr:IS256 family transposase [Thermoleophilaceae bacterium]